jgi:DNA polymerase III delta prime subunit
MFLSILAGPASSALAAAVAALLGVDLHCGDVRRFPDGEIDVELRDGVRDRDLYLIQGPPGTGKTTAIVEAIAQLCERNQRVLFSSHSNDAVDSGQTKLRTIPQVRQARLAEASRAGGLSRDYVLRWLGAVDPKERMEIMRRVMDPAVRFSVPILAVSVGGWWIQIARRLIWVTSETEDEGRLIELLLDKTMTGGDVAPLAAVEPILIAAPMTRQPADWAFTARIWTEGVRRDTDRPWSKLAKAIHGHGIPTITLDPVSTPHEIACQVVLKGYWHGYISGDEPALANAVAMAYPRQVERIQSVTRAPNRASAAATLLEQLIRPGFDRLKARRQPVGTYAVRRASR